MICIHCEHQFIGGAFIRGSGQGTSVAMRRCPKCEREFVEPPKPRAPGKAVTAEREACAKVAELVAREIDDTNGTATYIAKAIRARSER